jgi:dihydroorotate dehydrogenase (NAD+) catalytic subunit
VSAARRASASEPAGMGRGGAAPGDGRRVSGVDLTTRVGSVELPNPVMTASGTAGHGTELAPYLALGEIGAVVVKSLAVFAWPGHPPPRLHPTTAGMLNAVGLQGPGVAAWRDRELPGLVAAGARVVASIWGRTIDEYAAAATALAGSPGVVAVEVNLSCPNLERRQAMFAHDSAATRAAVAATAASGLPRWAKLSPNCADLAGIASAAVDGGAEAVTLVNTLLGMVIDTSTGRPALGHGGGGLSGAAIHPVAVRAVHDVRSALPDLPIIGVGGVRRGLDAVALMMAGADAIQVGTATFADPRAPARVLAEVHEWCARHGIARPADVVGAAHAGGLR